MGPVIMGAILFTDMVDSTALRSRIGEQRADQLRRHHDDLLRSMTQTHHGAVLRWTGDGMKASFPSASDAVSAAVDIQRAVVDYGGSEEAVAAFQVRIGVSIGEVTIDESGDHHGVAVIEAARLEALARPGEILATDMIRLLGSRRANVQFDPLGERTLKGLDMPVLVHRVVDLERAAAPPIPRSLTVESRTPLVGRDGPLEEFSRQWELSRVGAPGLMFVKGEAGIGKTRFVSHCAEIAHRSGALVLAGTCSSDVPVPYEPFAAAFRDASALDPTLSGAITGQGPLARLFPAGTVLSGEAQLGGARLELFDATAALIRRLGTTHPLVLILDDMHWATLPTVLMLQHLADDGDNRRLQIVVTYREGDLGASHPMRDILGVTSSGVRLSTIELSSLSEADIARIVTAAAPAASITRVAEIAEVVRTESAGNAFFASELIAHFANGGHLDQMGRGPTGPLPIPHSVHNVVLQRLEQLPEGARGVLVNAAVIGTSFDVGLLASVVERPADDVLDILDEVVRRGLLVEVSIDRFAFVHAIVRAALLEVLSPSRLARAHRSVAEAIEARGGDHFDELARHWQLGGEEGRSTQYLVRAARRDMDALAFESAKARYREVIDHQTRDSGVGVAARAEAWIGLAGALRALTDPSFKEAILRAARLARSAQDAQLMGEAAALSSWLGVWFFTTEVAEVEFIELCEDALTLLGADDPMRVRVLATLASHLTFLSESEPRAKLIAEANELAARHGDPLLSAAVLHAEFTCLWEPSTLERREVIARSLGRLARATGDGRLDFLGRYLTSYCRVERGEVTTAREELEALRNTIDPARNQYHQFLVDRMILGIDILLCVPEVQQGVDQLLQTYGATQVDAETSWMLQTGVVSMHAGTFGQMVNTAQAMTTGSQSNLWSAAYALSLFMAGDEAGADAVLNSAQHFPKNYFWTAFMQARAEVAAGVGNLDQCRRIFDELLPYRGRIGVTGSGSGCYGLVSRTLGQLAIAMGDLTVATMCLEEAIEQAEQIGAVFDAISSRRLLAEIKVAQGETKGLGMLIDEAVVVADKHGFGRELELLKRVQSLCSSADSHAS